MSTVRLKNYSEVRRFCAEKNLNVSDLVATGVKMAMNKPENVEKRNSRGRPKYIGLEKVELEIKTSDLDLINSKWGSVDDLINICLKKVKGV